MVDIMANRISDRNLLQLEEALQFQSQFGLLSTVKLFWVVHKNTEWEE